MPSLNDLYRVLVKLVSLTTKPQISACDCNNLFLTVLCEKHKPEDHWSCIAHLSAEDILKSAVIKEKKFKNIESE